jgi:hypothetical protein
MKWDVVQRSVYIVLLTAALGACNSVKPVPGAPAQPVASAAPSVAATPAKPAADALVPTRLSIVLVDPASASPEARAAANAIGARISNCWQAPASPEAPRVALRLGLNRDGSVETVTVMDKSAFSGNAVYRATATMATSAFFKCSPFTLPPAAYVGWKSLPLQITPHH